MSANTPSSICRLFQSYAHVDNVYAESLMLRLKQNFGASITAKFELWSDQQILLGTAWDESIKTQLARADVGLFLLSPASLASGYIQRIEIPVLLAASKLVLIGLRPVDFRTQLTHALQALQIFRLKTATGNELCYTECYTGPQKDAFAIQLYRAIRGLLAASAVTPI